MSALTPQEELVAQAVRRSHCANIGNEHKCVGQMMVTKDGVVLECKLCGSDPGRAPNAESSVILRRILRAAGLDWDSLDLERQLKVERAFLEDATPKPMVRFS